MPKPPKIVAPAKMPTTASFLSGGAQGAGNGMGQRPNKLIPTIGTSRSTVGKPSLLGGF